MRRMEQTRRTQSDIRRLIREQLQLLQAEIESAVARGVRDRPCFAVPCYTAFGDPSSSEIGVSSTPSERTSSIVALGNRKKVSLIPR